MMEDWKKIKLGDLGKTFTGLSGKKKDDFGNGKPFIPYLNIFTNSRINPDFIELVSIIDGEIQNKVNYGDLFFTTSSETIEEVGMTSVLLDEIGEAYLNSFCFGFRLNDFNTLLPEFARFLFRSQRVRHQISLKGQGSTRYNLSKTELLNKLFLDIPSKPEQTRIAEILSTADEAIEQTEKLIAKYQRIKTGLMQDLLTRGIDEHGNIRSKATHKFVGSNFRHNGVPSDWYNDRNLKDIAKVNQGLQIAIKNRYKEEGPKRYVYITIQYLNNIGKNKEFVIPPSESVICKKEDIIFTRTGNTGQVISNVDGVFHNNFFKVSYDRNLILKDYLINYLNWQPIQDLIKDLSGTTTIPDLKHKDFYSIPIFFPKNLTEQGKILSILNNHNSFIDNQIANLSKLHSLKTGLMQDLLSGRVRVTI